MKRTLTIASLLLLSVSSTADAKIIVTGASGMTGFPRSALNGKSIAGEYGYAPFTYLASLIGTTIGGTPGNGTYSYPNTCVDTTDPPAACPWSSTPAYPSCNTTNNKPVCDLACAGAFLNFAANNCMPICNISGSNCQAGSQIAYAVAKIAASGTNEIDLVVLNFSSNDLFLSCAGFESGSTAAWTTWKQSITASLSNIRTAINASASPNAKIVVFPEGRYYSVDQYWTYLGNQLVDCQSPPTVSNWGGWLSELLAYIRVESATYGAIYSDYVDRGLIDYIAKGYSENTYLTTDPTKCNVGGCNAGHLNHFGHRGTSQDTYRYYSLATGATDTDGDGLTNTYETNVSGTSTTLADTDGDGCNDGVELGGIEVFGGRRDPLNAYDFFDTNGDKKIDNADINAVKQRAELGIPNRAFSSTHQRLPALAYVVGEDPDKKDVWDTRQVPVNSAYPNNRPTNKDLLLIEAQKGHRCDCAADYSNCLVATGQECQLDIQCLSGVCGCDGATYSTRRCLAADTATGGYTADPRRCTNLAARKPCLEDGDCASNVCDDQVIPGYKVCVGNGDLPE